MTITVLPYGDRALLIELADTATTVAYADVVRADPALAGLLADVVPGARTVLLVARAGVALDRLRGAVPDLGVVTAAEPRRASQVRRISVTYDGPDLAEVARLTRLSEEEVVAAHTGSDWQVAFGGFAPGFAYLVGGDPRLRVPRRSEPRSRVPAGAVGLAGEFSGVYPRSSPGGWQLIGRTDAVLWDLARDEPALLSAGVSVRFEAVDG